MDPSAAHHKYNTFNSGPSFHHNLADNNNVKENIQNNQNVDQHARVFFDQPFPGGVSSGQIWGDEIRQHQQQRRHFDRFETSDWKEWVRRGMEQNFAAPRDHRPCGVDASLAPTTVRRRSGKRRKQANPRHVIVDKLLTEYQEEWEGEVIFEESQRASPRHDASSMNADRSHRESEWSDDASPSSEHGRRGGRPDRLNSSCEGLWNKHTQKKTQQDIEKLNRFLRQRNILGHIEDFEPPTLDSYFADFFMQAKKPDGTDYEPNTLRSILASFERYLKGHSYGRSVIHGREFTQARQALKTKQRQLKWTGKGRQCNVHRTIDENDTDLLFARGVLGFSSPVALINTVWWNNTCHFEMRSGMEHRNLKWGDIQLRYDPGKKCEYLFYRHRCSTPLDGVQSAGVAQQYQDLKIPMKVYSNSGGDPSDPKDPVSIYRAYASRRPTLSADSPFYLAIDKSRSFDQWYSHKPIGVNKLQSYMKSMLFEAGLQWNGYRISNDGPDEDVEGPSSYPSPESLTIPALKSDPGHV